MRVLKPLRRFCILFGLSAATAGMVAAAAFDPNSAAGVFRDKHERLRSLPPPRLILIGGSNLTYGLDSERLEHDLRLPVVNMGYSAGFGLRFMLDDTLPGIQRGDIAVVIPAYEQFQSSLLYGTGDILNILFYHPSSAIAVTSWRQVFKIVEYIPTFLQTNFKKHVLRPIVRSLIRRDEITEANYARADFNQQGDLIGYLKRSAPKYVGFTPLPADGLNPDTIQVLNRFFIQATERGVQVVLIFPPYGRTAYNEGQSTISWINNALRTQTRLNILGTPEGMVFPDDELFDGAYHLNASGRTKRTELMTQLLRDAIAAPSSALPQDKNR